MMKDIFECFDQLNWTPSVELHEDKFNKDILLGLLKTVSCLTGIEHVEEHDRRNSEAVPFFGWGACGISCSQIDGHCKSDLIFRKDQLFLLIENKLIRNGKNEEYNIKNALVQTIEYLNLYKVAGAVLLIFDAGRAKDREWDGNKEEKLINCLNSEYPLCVVRIREGYDTKIYYKDKVRQAARSVRK